ncbi:MAG TPA: anti-sigma factor [Acidobacteriaceae bacterium]
MPQAFHIEDDELIQFALGTLKDAQLTTLTAHISLCNECRARLGAIQLELAAYATALPQEGELPAGARDRFLAKLNAPAAQQSRLEQAREQGRGGAFARGLREWFASPIALWTLSGALTAAVIFLAYDDLSHIHENQQMVPEMKRLVQENAEYEELKEFLRGGNTQQVTLHQSASPNYAPSAHATYKPLTGRLVFTASNMPQLPPGKAYELWLLPASGAAPVPAGTFTPDLAGNGAIIFPKLPSNVPAKGFGITVEDARGAETPTLPIIMSGQ